MAFSSTEYVYPISALILSQQISFFVRANTYKVQMAAGEPKYANTIFTPCAAGDLVCLAALIGGKDFLVNTLQFTLDVFDLKLVGGGETPLTQLFILRLAEKFLGYRSVID